MLANAAVAALLTLLGAADVLMQRSTSFDKNDFCIAGIVRDEHTESPQPGVAVSIDSIERSAITDSAGAYRICGLEPGEYTVVIAADGINSVLQKHVVEPSPPEYAGFRAYRGLLPADKLPDWRGLWFPAIGKVGGTQPRLIGEALKTWEAHQARLKANPRYEVPETSDN